MAISPVMMRIAIARSDALMRSGLHAVPECPLEDDAVVPTAAARARGGSAAAPLRMELLGARMDMRFFTAKIYFELELNESELKQLLVSDSIFKARRSACAHPIPILFAPVLNYAPAAASMI